MDILIIVILFAQIIALVVGITAFRYMTDETKQLGQLFSDENRRLKQKIDDQAMVLNELKHECKQNKSSDNHDLIVEIIKILKPPPNIKQESPKQEIPKPKLPRRNESTEMQNVYNILDIE